MAGTTERDHRFDEHAFNFDFHLGPFHVGTVEHLYAPVDGGASFQTVLTKGERTMIDATDQSLWPNGPVVTLPGVGHFLQADTPETVTALVEQFSQMTP